MDYQGGYWYWELVSHSERIDDACPTSLSLPFGTCTVTGGAGAETCSEWLHRALQTGLIGAARYCIADSADPSYCPDSLTSYATAIEQCTTRVLVYSVNPMPT